MGILLVAALLTQFSAARIEPGMRVEIVRAIINLMAGVLPYHRGRILPLGAIRAIIAGSGIDLDKWLK